MRYLRHALVLCIVYLLCIAISFAIDQSFVRNENIFLLYILGVIIVLIETKNIWYGIVLSLLLVMSFNFFFTEPYYTFIVNDSNYIISLLIFFVVSIVVGSLVSKLQGQMLISKKNEKSIQTMYDFSRKFLNTHEACDIYRIVIDYLSEYLNTVCYIVTKDYKCYSDVVVDDVLREAIDYSLRKNIRVGSGEDKYSGCRFKVFPVKSKLYTFSCLLVDGSREYSDDDIRFINNIVNELVVILDREAVLELTERNKVSLETERFKTTLLRSLSHDIKTPLTTIQSGSKFLVDSYSMLSDEERIELIYEIYDESISISEFVVNLLNMSRLSESKRIMNLRHESIDDVFMVCRERISRIRTDKQVVFHELMEPIFIYTNCEMLVLVIYNLVDNAIKHTKDCSTIDVVCRDLGSDVSIEVIDNGGGVSADIIDKIFEDFYSLTTKSDNHRSTGLGLSICKSIVEAHGGRISVSNNDIGGATFSVVLPKEVVYEENIDN